MGYLILLSMGAVLGWLVSIIFKETNSRTVGIDIVAGALGATLLGLAFNASALMEELSASTFLYGCLGALGTVGIANMIRLTLIGDEW